MDTNFDSIDDNFTQFHLIPLPLNLIFFGFQTFCLCRI